MLFSLVDKPMVCVAVLETLLWMNFVKVSNTLTLVALMCTLLQTWLPMKEMKKVQVSGSVNCVIWDSMPLSYLTQL